MHVALHIAFGSELARLRAAELHEERASSGTRRHTRRPLPRRTGD